MSYSEGFSCSFGKDHGRPFNCACLQDYRPERSTCRSARQLLAKRRIKVHVSPGYCFHSCLCTREEMILTWKSHNQAHSLRLPTLPKSQPLSVCTGLGRSVSSARHPLTQECFFPLPKTQGEENGKQRVWQLKLLRHRAVCLWLQGTDPARVLLGQNSRT